MDQSIGSIPLEKRVELITLSKTINLLELRSIMGINLVHIHHILNHQDAILEKWKQKVKTISDDKEAIEVMLLQWLLRCKINKHKLTTTAINMQFKYITKLFELKPYEISSALQKKIDKILKQDFGIKRRVADDMQTILQTSKHLLKPHVYRRVMDIFKRETMPPPNYLDVERNDNQFVNDDVCKDTSTAEKEEGDNNDNDVMIIEKPITTVDISTDEVEISERCVKIKREFNDQKDNEMAGATYSDMDIPPLKTIHLPSDNNKEPLSAPQIKLEPQEIVTEPADFGELESKGDLENRNEFQDSEQDVLAKLKDEIEFLNETEELQIYKILDEAEEIMANEEREFVNEEEATEPNDSSEQKLRLEKHCDNLTEANGGDTGGKELVGADKEEDDIVTYEVDDSDDELEFLPETAQETRLRDEENEQGEEEEEEIITYVEIVSDEEVDEEEFDFDDDDLSQLQELLANTNSNELADNESVKNGKRTRSRNLSSSDESNDDNMPSTSSSNANSLQQAHLMKKPRLENEPLKQLAKISIQSNSEASQYLQHVEKYFQTQNDQTAIKLLMLLQLSLTHRKKK